MTINLCMVICDFCGTMPVLVEEPRYITREEARSQYDFLSDLVVANAECPACKAKYLAWVKDSQIHARRYGGQMRSSEPGATHFDLSFRSSFRDEPDDEDLPEYQVVYIAERVGPWRRG